MWEHQTQIATNPSNSMEEDLNLGLQIKNPAPWPPGHAVSTLFDIQPSYHHCVGIYLTDRLRVVPLSLCPSCVTRTKTARKKWPRDLAKEGLLVVYLTDGYLYEDKTARHNSASRACNPSNHKDHKKMMDCSKPCQEPGTREINQVYEWVLPVPVLSLL